MQVSGLGPRRLELVPGEDSLQSLILAMEFVHRVLPVEATREGGQLQWLGEREHLVFANTQMSGLLARSLQNCLTELADALSLLEKPGTKPAARTAARMRALVASGGYTADTRRITRPPAAKHT